MNRRLISLASKLFNYLRERHLESLGSKIRLRLWEHKDSSLPPFEILKSLLIECGYTEKDAKSILFEAMKHDVAPDAKPRKGISPSFKYYKPKQGSGTSKAGYKSYRGGAPGLGKGKS